MINRRVAERIADAPVRALKASTFGRAQRFVLVDEAGKEREVLSMFRDDPELALFDDAGEARLVLDSTATEDTRTGAATRHPISTITLYDETGGVRRQAP